MQAYISVFGLKKLVYIISNGSYMNVHECISIFSSSLN